MAPSTTKQWTITGKEGFDSLKFEEKAEIPNLGDHDVLVNFHYASLNYRDLIIPKVRTFRVMQDVCLLCFRPNHICRANTLSP